MFSPPPVVCWGRSSVQPRSWSRGRMRSCSVWDSLGWLWAEKSRNRRRAASRKALKAGRWDWRSGVWRMPSVRKYSVKRWPGMGRGLLGYGEASHVLGVGWGLHRGCGSTRAFGDFGPAHHERWRAP